MPTAPQFRPRLVLAAALGALLAFTGCNRHAMLEVTAPPDLIKDGKTDSRALALRMRVFHVQHIWAGAGYEAAGADYRAKVSIWSYSQGEPALAELYFHDTDKFDPAGRHQNSDPHAAGAGTHQIHFPTSTFGAIIALMRSANEPVYLFYFKGRWAIGTSLAEAIGSE